MTGFFDRAGREYTPAELALRLPALSAAARTSRVVVELLDAQGARVTTLAPAFATDLAASIVAARIIPDAPEGSPANA